MWAYESDCPFCMLSLGGSTPAWKDVFPNAGSSDLIKSYHHFSLIMDIAPIVQGHLLIVANRHMTSLAECTIDQINDLQEIKTEITPIITRMYSKPTFFEHGACDSSNRAGACIDHAHLHVLPGNFNLIGRLKADYPGIRQYKTHQQALLAFKGRPYIYYENPDGSIYAAEVQACQSQYLRKIVADSIGDPYRWSWQDCITFAKELGTLRDLQRFHNKIDKIMVS